MYACESVRLCASNNIENLVDVTLALAHTDIKSHCIVYTMALFVLQSVYVFYFLFFSFSLLPFLTRKNSKSDRALSHKLSCI